MLPRLSHEEILRYSRHLLIPEVGLEGQRKLKAAAVLLVGTAVSSSTREDDRVRARESCANECRTAVAGNFRL